MSIKIDSCIVGKKILKLQQGKALVEDEHPDNPDIKKTMKDLNSQWKELYDKSMDKGQKLRQATDQHDLNKALADAQVRNLTFEQLVFKLAYKENL